MKSAVFRLLLPLAFLNYLSLAVCTASETRDNPSVPTQAELDFFESRIRPLLINHCVDCHGKETQESALRLDSWLGMLTGGKAGPVIVPGKPDSSLLLTAVRYVDNDLRMPPDERLSKAQVRDLQRWIEMGAPHPEQHPQHSRLPSHPGSSDSLHVKSDHWAFQIPSKPSPPSSSFVAANPIDAFIDVALEANDLRPLEAANKRTLIRRATFDLTGLPPTQRELQAFLADDSETAFERVVDRLLASPHYGERWGRHWLDIARYADSNGLDENVAHGNAWRYRDYVVQSLNSDKPYNQFLVEQLAGDLLDSSGDSSTHHQRLIATGFLVLGPKVLAEVDKEKLKMDIVDEQLDTLGRSLMGLTLGCARCHDHKFDPISSRDYYAMAGIFTSTQTMETLETVARWNENSIASCDDLTLQKQFEQRLAEKNQQLEQTLLSATENWKRENTTSVPEDVEQQFSAQTQAQLKLLREQIEQLKANAPEMPTAMGVTDGTIANTAIHLRGSPLTLGEVVPRGFPRVLSSENPPCLPDSQSGRLELARWLADKNHPLTARVMVNRIWRWHFGKGLVETVDNFGIQGSPPTHPALLDWLAVEFMEQDWSIKAMHRLIMTSQAYQRSSRYDPHNASRDVDNRFYWRRDLRRLEAETIRDHLLAVSGNLDRTIGGNLLPIKNREYLFNHTSQDKSTYDSICRRSIYVPVIRNHLYDVFQLFDYTDASVLNGDRDTSIIAPQALFLMNSEWMKRMASDMAKRLAESAGDQREGITRLFLEAYGRPPTEEEARQASNFLQHPLSLESRQSDDSATTSAECWQALCHAVLSSSEFIYLR
ncbi:MAG: PSD1 and planctomycete cytochrome C domain-containing protein [bacterium]|nr:PSD1 and planctomycete cytochrome C domain-containing protein [bacterium]